VPLRGDINPCLVEVLWEREGRIKLPKERCRLPFIGEPTISSGERGRRQGSIKGRFDWPEERGY